MTGVLVCCPPPPAPVSIDDQVEQEWAALAHLPGGNGTSPSFRGMGGGKGEPTTPMALFFPMSP